MLRKTVKELVEIGYDIGLGERQMFNLRGGAVRKEVLVANILARLEQIRRSSSGS